MEGALKTLVLAALILLVTAQTDYKSLPDLYRKHIDKALKTANSNFGAGHHVAFHSVKGKPKTMESILNVNVLLMVTTCKKTSRNAYEHRDECDKRKANTPIIDCLVCKTTDGNELVDCAMMKAVNTIKHKDIRNKCPNYHTGGGNIMTQQSEDNKRQTGCLGCI